MILIIDIIFYNVNENRLKTAYFCIVYDKMLMVVVKFPMLIGSAQPTNLLELLVKEVISMSIGERLHNLRKERNFSQEDLANELGVSRQTVSKWETGESTPDFDKIIPLCNFFGITSDELISGKQNIVEVAKENKKAKFARNIAISVALYILSLVAIIAFSTSGMEIVGVCLFFTIIAVATGLIIYSAIVYGKDKEKEKKSKEATRRNEVAKSITDIIGLIGVVVYFLVSFTTGAWHITWIIFLIIGVCNAIVRLIFELKKCDDNECASCNHIEEEDDE